MRQIKEQSGQLDSAIQIYFPAGVPIPGEYKDVVMQESLENGFDKLDSLEDSVLFDVANDLAIDTEYEGTLNDLSRDELLLFIKDELVENSIDADQLDEIISAYSGEF